MAVIKPSWLSALVALCAGKEAASEEFMDVEMSRVLPIKAAFFNKYKVFLKKWRIVA